MEQLVDTQQSTEQSEPATPAETPKQDGFSKQLAALSRKEREMKASRQIFDTDRKSFEDRQKDYETNYIPKSKLNENLIDVLTSNGVDLNTAYNSLTKAIMDQPSESDKAMSELQKQIKALTDAQEQSKLEQQKNQDGAYQAALKQIERDVTELVKDSEEYETIRTTGSHKLVVDLIEEVFKRDGTVMDIAEASREIEKELFEDVLKFAKMKKLTQHLSQGNTPFPDKKLQNKQPQTTLNNQAMQLQTPSRLTEKQRIERAKLAFEGKLT